MKWTSLTTDPHALIDAEGPFQTLAGPRTDRGWQWTVICHPAGQSQQIIGQELCNSREDAQSAADAKLESVIVTAPRALAAPSFQPSMESNCNGTS